jgi:hypothetical protein
VWKLTWDASSGSLLATIHWVTREYLRALALLLPLNGWLVDGTRPLFHRRGSVCIL